MRDKNNDWRAAQDDPLPPKKKPTTRTLKEMYLGRRMWVKSTMPRRAYKRYLLWVDAWMKDWPK